jgi:hypothetical protein
VVTEYQQPGDVTVGYLAVTNPLPAAIDRILTTPMLNVRPAGGGRLLLQALDLDATAAAGTVPARNSDLAREFIRRLQEVLENTGNAHITELHVGVRAMPADGRSVIGAVPSRPWLYLVATHSGVTLAPFLGPAPSWLRLAERIRTRLSGKREGEKPAQGLIAGGEKARWTRQALPFDGEVGNDPVHRTGTKQGNSRRGTWNLENRPGLTGDRLCPPHVNQHRVPGAVGNFIHLCHGRVHVIAVQNDPGLPHKVDNSVGTEYYCALAAIDSDWFHFLLPQHPLSACVTGSRYLAAHAHSHGKAP